MTEASEHMRDSLLHHNSLREIMNDTGLAQIGDALVNLCYSVAKSLALGKMGGEKVRDSVLARAIRATSFYHQIGHRTDAGEAGDAYEALIGYLWLKEAVSVDEIIEILLPELHIDKTTSRKKEGEIAALAFQRLLERLADRFDDVS